jgi:hypothetical protein
VERTDILRAESTNLKPRSEDEIDVTLDMGTLVLDDRIDDTFDDLIARGSGRGGNLLALKKCRHVLRDGGRLRLTNTHKGASEKAYLELQEMLLRAAGFTDMRLQEGSGPTVMECTKRAPVLEDEEFDMSVREIVDPEDVQKAHTFAHDYYYYKDFNYDFEVTRQFDLQTDIFAAYDKTGEMVALARCALRVPGYNCPFMYAVTEDGSHYRIPSRYRRSGEVMAIYKEGKNGVVGYKRLMEFLTQYAAHIAHADSIWTTNEVNDPYTGNLYKNKFMMEEMGAKLTYRDFGGKWNLLCTDKILELSAIHRGLFRR